MARSKQKAFSLVEVILAIAMFSLLAGSLTITSLGGMNGLITSHNQLAASTLADEALNACQSLTWDDLSIMETGLATTSSGWSLKGAGTADTFGSMTRTITIENACRLGGDLSTSCETAPDIFYKKITVLISWLDNYGRNRKLTRTTYVYRR